MKGISINMSENKNYYKPKFIKMICENPDCKKEFEINIKTYRTRIKNIIPMYCPNCMKKYVSDNVKEKFNDPEYVKKHSESTKAGIANMSSEAKNKQSKNISSAKKKDWANLSDDEYNQRCSNISTGTTIGMANMSLEAKKQMNINMMDGINKISYEEKIESWYKHCIKYNQISINYMPTLLRQVDDIINTEGEFMRILLNNNIGNFVKEFYNLYPHPNFHELFPNNPITGAKYVSPFHRWDFIIRTIKTDIFIDIDGSIHDSSRDNGFVTYKTGKNEILVNLKELKQFDDSQRKYQTDNLPAYRVICYDNKLSLNTAVVNIYDDNDIITIKDLINLIHEYNKN